MQALFFLVSNIFNHIAGIDVFSIPVSN